MQPAHDRSIAIRDVVLSGTAADRAKEVAAIKVLADFYAAASGSLEKMIGAPGTSPDLTRLYADIKEIENSAVTTTKAIITAVEQGDAPGAHKLLWSQAKPQYVQWLAAINKLIDFEEQRIQVENRTALDQAGGFMTVMLAALVLSLLICGALAWFISRSILDQLGAEPVALGEAAKRIADGDLGAVPGAANAAAGSVLSSLGIMQVSLSRLVGQVRSASDSISTGSQQIATGNSDLSRRTESQAHSLRQTTVAMHQLSQTVKGNAETAAEANRMAGSAWTSRHRPESPAPRLGAWQASARAGFNPDSLLDRMSLT